MPIEFINSGRPLSNDEQLTLLSGFLKSLDEVKVPSPNLATLHRIDLGGWTNHSFVRDGRTTIALRASVDPRAFIQAVAKDPLTEPAFQTYLQRYDTALPEKLSSALSGEEPAMFRLGHAVLRRIKEDKNLASERVLALMQAGGLTDVSYNAAEKKYVGRRNGATFELDLEKNQVLYSTLGVSGVAAPRRIKFRFSEFMELDRGKVERFQGSEKTHVQVMQPGADVRHDYDEKAMFTSRNPIQPVAPGTAPSGKAIVAIIDSGVDYNHPWVKPNILRQWQDRGLTEEDIMNLRLEYFALAKEVAAMNEKGDIRAYNNTVTDYNRMLYGIGGAGGVLVGLLAVGAKVGSPTPPDAKRCRKLWPWLVVGAVPFLPAAGVVAAKLPTVMALKNKISDNTAKKARLKEIEEILKSTGPGWDFVEDDPLPSHVNDVEGYGHGTGVASIIARDKDIAILSLRHSTTSDGAKPTHPRKHLNPDMMKMVEYASQRGAHVVNMSLGMRPEELTEMAKKYPKMLFVVSAGNEKLDLDKERGWTEMPKLDNLLLVACHDETGAVWNGVPYGSAFGSQYGKTTVHLAALGTNVTVAHPGNGADNGSGTSISAPQVARVAARIKLLRPEWTPGQIAKHLMDTVQKRPEWKDLVISGGILDEEAAVAAATPKK